MFRHEPSLSAEARIFDRHGPLPFSIAYRMLGSVMDAEDVVQGAHLRWRGTDKEVRTLKAHLSVVVTRLIPRSGFWANFVPAVLDAAHREGAGGCRWLYRLFNPSGRCGEELDNG